MDKGYSDNKTRTSLREQGYIPVVPPKRNARKPWMYSKNLYRQRNEIERLFHHLKNFRRVATRYDKLDLTFCSFVALALSIIYLNIC
jgi:transposase